MNIKSLLFCCLLFVLAACDPGDTRVEFSSDFESGSIGQINQLSNNEWALYLRDDNDDTALPASWRSWWYFKISNTPVNTPLTLRIRNSGWAYYYVPVYSYDQVTWYHFDEREVTQSADCAEWAPTCELVIRGEFTQQEVYIARFFPYTYSDLQEYIASLAGNPYVEITTLGQSSAYAKDIQLIKIADPNTPIDEQTRVWLHARSHPAESGAAFMLEGLIDQALADLQSGVAAASKIAYYIAPMHNPDGVIAGNYRSTPASVNLESTWFISADNLIFLAPDAPYENQLLNGVMAQLASQYSSEKPIIALNLHSSNSEPDTPAFAFPHFGDDPSEYSSAEQNLWNNSITLLELIAMHYDYRIYTTGAGGRGFLDYAFPETWWWENLADGALAMTIETTYGRAGFDHWVRPDDQRDLGMALVSALYDYLDPSGVVPGDTFRFNVDESIELPSEIESKL